MCVRCSALSCILHFCEPWCCPTFVVSCTPANESKLLYDIEMSRRRKAGHDLAEDADLGDHDDGWLASVQRELLKQCDEYETMLKEQELKDREASPYKHINDFDKIKFHYGSPLEENNIERLSFWPRHKGRFFLLYYPACVTVVKSYSAMKMERTNSAAGHINSRFRSCQKAETLDTMVLAQEWMKELSSRADVPRGLVDLQAWRVVVGDDGGGEWWGCDADV